MQNALKDGRLKFADKHKPHPEEDNEIKTYALFVEPVDVMVVDIITSVGVVNIDGVSFVYDKSDVPDDMEMARNMG